MRIYKVSTSRKCHKRYGDQRCFILAWTGNEAKKLGAKRLKIPYRVVNQERYTEDDQVLQFLHTKTDQAIPYEDWINNIFKEMTEGVKQ